MLRVLASAFTDPSGRPTQETAVFALQAAGDLIEESQRIIKPVIQRPAINRLSGTIWPAPAIVRRPGTR